MKAERLSSFRRPLCVDDADKRIQFAGELPKCTVAVRKLTADDLYRLTQSPYRKKFVKELTKRQRLEAKKNSRQSKRQKAIDDAREKLMGLKSFLDCPGSDRVYDEISIIRPKLKAFADIDRECSFSETSSVTGSSSSGSRPRRLSSAPQRFTITREPKPKSVAKKEKKVLDPNASYEVEAIVDMNLINNEIFARVKWEDYPHEDNTWEPLENLIECEALKEFLRYEFEGNEDAIKEELEKLKEEQKHELAVYEKKSKSLIMHELKSFDPIKFQCYQVIYMATKNETDFYLNFRKKFRHMIVLNHFHELDIQQYEEHKKISGEIMDHEQRLFSLSIVNDVDFQFFQSFQYIRENSFPPEVAGPKEDATGCNCEGGCSKESDCCPTTIKKASFAYKEISGKNRLRIARSQMIYECNDKCACGIQCLNRVTQQPRLIPLAIFKTPDNRGWGLKTKTNIPKGTFLMEYTGEVIDQEESIRRGKVYDEIGQSYLFDLDYDDNKDAVYTIDAFMAGNLSRLINHSCEPNCRIWPVTDCSKNSQVYKICYFSTRLIKAGEELTFDYSGGDVAEREIDEDDVDGMTGNATRLHRTNDACKCGSQNCRGFIFL